MPIHKTIELMKRLLLSVAAIFIAFPALTKERQTNPKIYQAIATGERYCNEEVRRHPNDYEGGFLCPLFTATIDIDAGTVVYGRRPGIDGAWEAKNIYSRGDKVFVFKFRTDSTKGDKFYLWISKYGDKDATEAGNQDRIEAKYLKPFR